MTYPAMGRHRLALGIMLKVGSHSDGLLARSTRNKLHVIWCRVGVASVQNLGLVMRYRGKTSVSKSANKSRMYYPTLPISYTKLRVGIRLLWGLEGVVCPSGMMYSSETTPGVSCVDHSWQRDSKLMPNVGWDTRKIEKE